MKKQPLGGLAVAGMLLWAPPAAAGYWTGHSNLIRDLIENWVIDQLEEAGYSPSTRSEQKADDTLQTDTDRSEKTQPRVSPPEAR